MMNICAYANGQGPRAMPHLCSTRRMPAQGNVKKEIETRYTMRRTLKKRRRACRRSRALAIYCAAPARDDALNTRDHRDFTHLAQYCRYASGDAIFPSVASLCRRDILMPFSMMSRASCFTSAGDSDAPAAKPPPEWMRISPMFADALPSDDAGSMMPPIVSPRRAASRLRPALL